MSARTVKAGQELKKKLDVEVRGIGKGTQTKSQKKFFSEMPPRQWMASMLQSCGERGLLTL